MTRARSPETAPKTGKTKATAAKRPSPQLEDRPPIVADVMTQVVVTLDPESSIQEAVDLFASRHISGAPVIAKSGEIRGVLSTTDILRAETTEAEREIREHDYFLADESSGTLTHVPRNLDARRVIDIATRKVVSIDENAPLAEAAKVLFELGIRRLLVTRNGRFAGLLSATDILKWVARPVLESEGD